MIKLPWDRKTVSRNAALALILILIALAIHEVFGERGLLALRRQREEVETLQRQIQQLQQEKQQLERDIKALKSDPKAIEKLAREQMRLARPGEIIYTLPGKKSPPPAEPGIAETEKPKR